MIEKYRVKLIVDVRRWPVSRRVSWACRENLEGLLASAKVHYLWLGQGLGGYREGGYKNYMHSREYLRSINVLVGLAHSVRKGYLAVMCMEKLWFRCHRRFIADTLAGIGFRVFHIIEENRVVEHKSKKVFN